MSRIFLQALSCCALVLIGGCGLTVPQLNEAWEPADIDDELVYRIKKSIYCELVKSARVFNADTYRDRGNKVSSLPADWGAQMTLTLSADEISGLNPSGSYNRNISPASDPAAIGGRVAQSLTLPFTTELSSQAVRTDTTYSFYTVKELVRPRIIDTTCIELFEDGHVTPLDRRGSSLLLSENLGIRSWLKGALLAKQAIPESDLPKSAKSLEVLQYSVKFIVVTGGSFNPTWRLAPVTTGIGLPLLSGRRVRTHQLLLTVGPTSTEAGKQIPIPSATTLHATGQFGQVVGDNFRSVVAPLR